MKINPAERLLSILVLSLLVMAGISSTICAGYTAGLQSPPPPPPPGDKKTVFKDESGKIITSDEFMEYLMKGGYKAVSALKRGQPENVVQLVKLKPGEKNPTFTNKADKPHSKVAVGTRAPDFKAETLDGKNISLDDYKGKVLVMNFWFIACKPCVMEIPELNKIVAKYKGNPDIAFVSVAMDGKKEVTDFMKKHQFDYQIVPAAHKILASFDVEMYPTHLIIGRDGLISYRTYGLGPNSIGNLEGGIRDAMRNMHPRQGTF